MRVDSKNDCPVALILGLQTTALATARSLAEKGVDVQVAAFRSASVEKRSKSFHYIDATRINVEADEVADWLYDYADQLSERPVVFPSSDTTALALAKHRDRLSRVCRITQTSYEELNTIVSKEGLYRRAGSIGLPTPSAIVQPSIDELEGWCEAHKAPYLVKPFYQGIPGYTLGEKTLSFDSHNRLLAFVRENGAGNLIIQRQIVGGDGFVFDCYGYCNKKYEVVTQVSHTRLRQCPKDFGTTSYGEIPARTKNLREELLFELTDKLLAGLEYQGIFGIEWIQDRESKELFLIDFNARPFLSVGHLTDCGVNLPYLAYRELAEDDDLKDVERYPHVKHKYWLRFQRDFETLPERLANNEITIMGWLVSLLRVRSYAVWRWTDILPGLHLWVRFLRNLIRKS
jgi:predicted ATP-grasp superfamily ATP-dependent carboligase